MYEARTQEEILAEMLESSTTATAKFEGTFEYDVHAANSIELAKVEAEMEQLYKAAFADYSWGDYLTMQAKQYGVIRKAAVQAKGIVTVTGNGIVPAGSLFATAGGIRFSTDKESNIVTQGAVAVTAVDAGSLGNVAAGTISEIPMSIPGIDSVTNDSDIADGYDEETDAALLERYLLKVRTPATSGNKYHYLNWALAVNGVGNARVLPLWDGPGTVKLIIVNDNCEAASDYLVQTVKNSIEELRPIGAEVTVVSAKEKAIDVSAIITGSYDIDVVKNKLITYFKSVGFDIDYVSIARIGKMLLECSGINDYSDLKIGGQTDNILLTKEELPTLGEVTLNVSASA